MTATATAGEIRDFRRALAPIWRDGLGKQHAYAQHLDGFIAARSLCRIAWREDFDVRSLPICSRCEEIAAR